MTLKMDDARGRYQPITEGYQPGAGLRSVAFVGRDVAPAACRSDNPTPPSGGSSAAKPAGKAISVPS